MDGFVGRSGVGEDALEWHLRGVVGFCTLRAVTGFGDELLLRPKVFGCQSLYRPNLVQQLQLGGGVVEVVSGHSPHDVPDLLLDVCTTIFGLRPRPSKRQPVLLTPTKRLPS